MTFEDFQEYAKKLLTVAIGEIRKTGSPINAFHLVAADHVDVIVVAGGEMNDPVFKDKLALDLRARIDHMQAEAYFMVSDTFVAFYRADDVQATRKEQLRQSLGLTIEAAAQIGLCEVREAISIMAELQNGRVLSVVQEYMRDPKDNRKITIQAEPQIVEMSGGAGRFLGMWKEPAGGSLHSKWKAGAQ